MAKWLSYCRASGCVWVAQARVAVGLAMDHQTVPTISSAPVELLIEGVFDRHLPWKSAFRQRTAMCELRLRLIFSIMLLHVWCDNNRMCPDSFFFKSDSVSAMHASRQVVQVRASVFKLQINTDWPDFTSIWNCLLAFCAHNNVNLVIGTAGTAIAALTSRYTIYYVARLFTETGQSGENTLPPPPPPHTPNFSQTVHLITAPLQIVWAPSSISASHTSTSSSSVRAWQTEDTSADKGALSGKQRGQLHVFWNFVSSLTTYL